MMETASIKWIRRSKEDYRKEESWEGINLKKEKRAISTRGGICDAIASTSPMRGV